MKIIILILSFLLFAQGAEPIVPGLPCVKDVTKLTKIVCPDGTIKGDEWVAPLDPYNCNITRKNCSQTPVPPPPPPKECYACPVRDGGNKTTENSQIICKDGSIGGLICNKTTCTWTEKKCDPYVYVPHPGLCPFFDEYDSVGAECIRVNDPCKSDDDCEAKEKCCMDPCGITCKEADTETPRDGYCPAVSIIADPAGDEIGICIIECNKDSECQIDNTTKCCTAPCGGSQCVHPVQTKPVECKPEDCDAVIAAATSSATNLLPKVCADGTVERFVCQRVDGSCRPIWTPCKDPVVPIIHDGFCPAAIAPTAAANCTAACTLDNDCSADKKCCFLSTACKSLQCLPSVNRKCVVAGYRKSMCIFDDAAEIAKYPNTVPDTVLPDKCYRCIEQVNCASNSDRCGWFPADKYSQCIADCTKPDPVVPVVDPCVSKNPCDCLKADNCSLCQFTRTFHDDDQGADFKVPFSVCLPKAISNKCIVDSTADGFSGTVIYTRPTACDLPDVKDSFDPSIVAGSDEIKNIVKQVTDGKFNPKDYQKCLDDFNITDIVVQVVGQPTCDGVKGKISVIVTIVKAGRTPAQIKDDLNKAISKFFDVPISRIETTLQAAVDSVTTKRSIFQAAGDDLLQTTTITPAATPDPSPEQPTPQPNYVPQPGSAAKVGFGLLAVWLVGLLALLF